MTITLHRDESLQIVVDEQLFTLFVDSRQIVLCNNTPLKAAIEQYRPVKPSEQFVEQVTNIKQVKGFK